MWHDSPSLTWEKDLKERFSCGYSQSYHVYERRGLVTDMCMVHKSTDTTFFLDFWPVCKCLLCSCTPCATVFCDMQGIWYSSARSAHLATAAAAAFLAL